MIAIVGIPGSSGHQARHFPRGRRREAERWATDCARRQGAEDPHNPVVPCEVVSDREALRRRYRDGTRVYRHLFDAD